MLFSPTIAVTGFALKSGDADEMVLDAVCIACLLTFGQPAFVGGASDRLFEGRDALYRQTITPVNHPNSWEPLLLLHLEPRDELCRILRHCWHTRTVAHTQPRSPFRRHDPWCCYLVRAEIPWMVWYCCFRRPTPNRRAREPS